MNFVTTQKSTNVSQIVVYHFILDPQTNNTDKNSYRQVMCYVKIQLLSVKPLLD